MDTRLQVLTEDYAGEAFTAQTLCPICAGSSRVRHVAANIHPEKPLLMDLRICAACGHGWIDPMPSQGLLSHLYAKGSRSVIGVWGKSEMSIPERMCVKSEIDRPPGRLFELGVGQGRLYQMFIDRGWQCTGVDPGDWSSRFPNIFRDLSAVPQNLEATLLVAFDVLEHVTDPISVLTNLRTLAASNARLYCAMPNISSFRARWHGKNWRMVRPLGHVNYFSKKSAALALASSGFALRSAFVSDLSEPGFPKNLSQLKAKIVDLLGLGDQLIVTAEAAAPAISRRR